MPRPNTHTRTHAHTHTHTHTHKRTHTHAHTHIHTNTLSCKDLRCATCDNGNCKCVPKKEKGQTCGDGTHRAPEHSGFECASHKVLISRYVQKRPTLLSKETYISVKIDLHSCQKRPAAHKVEHILISIDIKICSKTATVWTKRPSC